jgi:excisionase family DNA binding protein
MDDLLSEIRALRDEIVGLKTEVAKLSRDKGLPTEEAKHEVGCSAQTLRKLAKAGKIPYSRLGKDFRFSRADLKAFRESPAGSKAIAKLEEMNQKRKRSVPYE